jgi:hypothetical protein
MKTARHPFFALRFLLLALAATLLGGCLQDRLVWSPDGRRAAVITDEGLYLCDAEGRLSPLLAPGVYRAAWLGGSEQLVVAQTRKVKDFPALAAALGATRTRALTVKADATWQKLQAGRATKEVGEELAEDGFAVLLYLREHHRDELRKILGPDWKDAESATVELHALRVARITGDTLELGPARHESLAGIQGIRAAPDGRAIAFTTKLELSPDINHGLHLFVAPTDGSAPAALVASQTAAEPDWTADGRSLVYLKAQTSADKDDNLRLGVLAQREVLARDGRIQLGENARELAGLVFQRGNRVRCLRNGRVLFAAAELHLPIAGETNNIREQLFALDPGPQPTLTRLISPDVLEQLPKSLSYFAVSPDENQVLFGHDDGGVWLLTLGTGTVEPIAPKIEGNKNFAAPAWRQNGEFVFLRKGEPARGSKSSRPVEVFLRRGKSEKTFSASWPDEMLRRLIE